MKILLADDSKLNLAILTSSMEAMGHEVFSVSNGESAIKMFQENKPDLVILDVVMEGMDGFECAKQLRALDTQDWIPIIFLSASVDDKSISKGIDAGGDDYLAKPVSEITLAAKIKAMQRISDMRKQLFELTKKLGVLSSTDTLTGLYNRLQFDRAIHEKISSASRHAQMIALLFIDLDRFKTVNDTKGHHIGDALLKTVAQRLKSCIRFEDFIARIGGDEFAVILPQFKTTQDVAVIAQKMIQNISEKFSIEGHGIEIGVSIGIAVYPSMGSTVSELIKNADTAMYKVKESGRNNFKFYIDPR